MIIWKVESGPMFQMRSENVPKGYQSNNKFSESIFGHLNRLMWEKANMSTIAKEACLMFSHNHTLEWLQMKPDGEVTKLLSEASKAVRKTRKCFKERQQSIKQARRAAVAESMRKQLAGLQWLRA